MSYSTTKSQTYTDADVAKVVVSVRADLKMIASSSRGLTDKEVNDYADDIETLAKAGYLEWVDIALYDDGVEKQAVRYTTSADASGWTTNRPGGVLWPWVAEPEVQVVIRGTDAYTPEAKASMKPKLKNNWGPSSADTSHSSLNGTGGRNYASNSFGMARKDWAA